VKLRATILSVLGVLHPPPSSLFPYTTLFRSEADVTFQYQITDGDGDGSSATVTIHLQPDSVPTVTHTPTGGVVGGDGQVLEAARSAGPTPVRQAQAKTGSRTIPNGSDTLQKL